MALVGRFLRRHAVALVIALVATVIAWAFVVVTLHHTPSMGFPLDDSYIYLTYAKQFGRAHPFTYWSGGGYSAGSTSVLWPMVLAPFWTLGARGHALVWVSYVACAVLYGLTGLGVYRLAKRLAVAQGEVRGGGELAGAIAAGVTLGIAPFAFTALSGMEVAFASALLAWSLVGLADAPAGLPPSRKLGVLLAATSLSRPEAMLLVGAICGVCALVRMRGRAWRAAAWWLAPLAAPVAWLVANKVFAGHLFPNTGVAKSHFYMPGFDWTYWWATVKAQTGKCATALFWDGDSPLLVPRVLTLAWLVGAVRVWLGGRSRLVVAFVVIAPVVLVMSVIASSGFWNVQNYRYIAPAFPLFAVPVGLAFAPVARVVGKWWWCVVLVVVGGYGVLAVPKLADDMTYFAQGAMDTNTQVVPIGKFVHDHLPADARVMFHDAGAIAYYGDGEVYDMLGLVTNDQAGVANNGPGARFEFLESLPVEKRPTHFAYYPTWLGTDEFWIEPALLTTPYQAALTSKKQRLVGDSDMRVYAAKWDHVGTGERPLGGVPEGWAMVDRVDIADLVNERAHGWHGDQGRRAFGDPTAKWSMVGKSVDEHGLVLDGGRTIRGKRETFTIARDPAKPAKLVLRSGGATEYPVNEAIVKPAVLTVHDADTGAVLATATVPVPHGRFDEIAFELPAGATTHVEITADAPYRAFHYFVLQPSS